MATILTKRSNTASSVPVAGDLTNSTGGAELAVNTADKRLFTKDSGGTVVELGTNPSSITLASGTANAVPYLNGSKVLTTGSALTFDGTNLATSGVVRANAGARFQGAGSLSGTGVGAEIFSSGGVTFYASYDRTANAYAPLNLFSDSYTAFSVGSEQMRLTSTGLGIGTSSPASKLHVESSSATTNTKVVSALSGSLFYSGFEVARTTVTAGALMRSARNASTGGVGWEWLTTADNSAEISGSYTSRMMLDNVGNLGLGVTPSAWGSGRRALQIAGSAANYFMGANANATVFGTNFFYDDAVGNNKYVATGAASMLLQSGGAFQFFTAPSGTAGNAISFTQAMSLLSSGELLVGKTSTSTSASGLVLQNYANVAGGISCVKTASGQYTAWSNFYSGTYIGGMEYTNIATIFATSSDYRLKNITGPITNSGEYIDSLNPVEGTWKADGSTFVGLIAHEAQEASRTQVATGVKDGEQMQGMDYSSSEIIANMIAELKSLRQRVAQLEQA